MAKTETENKTAKNGNTSSVSRRVGAPAGPRKADHRRASLIQAAEELFVEKGLEATTMNEIARRAGFAKGTLYHYFANKAELLQTLRNKFDDEVVRDIRSHVEQCSPDDRHGRIKAWISAASTAYFEKLELHDVVIYGTNMPFRQGMAEAGITKYLAELIREGTRHGAWQVADEHWTAVIMFYSYRGGCDEVITGAQRREDVVEKLYDVFLRILGCPV